jgi:hypothetical protein
MAEIYRGLLDREADATGLTSYTASVGRSGDLASALREIAGSDEAWRVTLRRRAPQIVRQLADALCGSEAPAEDLALWESQLSTGTPIGDIAAAMARSASHRRRFLGEDADGLVVDAFEALLGRHPDVHETAAHTAVVREGGVQALLATVGRSDEHRALLRADEPPPPQAAAAPDAEALVTATFRALLGREPDPEALAAYSEMLRAGGELATFMAEVARSPEHRKRVLLKQG